MITVSIKELWTRHADFTALCTRRSIGLKAKVKDALLRTRIRLWCKGLSRVVRRCRDLG